MFSEIGKHIAFIFEERMTLRSRAKFITWPVQSVIGQLLLLSSSEVGQHLFEANINGAVACYELNMKFEM